MVYILVTGNDQLSGLDSGVHFIPHFWRIALLRLMQTERTRGITVTYTILVYEV